MIKCINVCTQRLAQLTGDYDPQNLSHINFTTPWKCIGVDLGANTEHDGLTFIFFGDVVTPDGYEKFLNTDLIGFIDHAQLVAGTNLVAANQADQNQLDVFFIDENQRLCVSWVMGGGIWQGPVRISPTGIAPKGACLATAHQIDDNQLDVFFIGEDGGLYVSWVIGGGVWQGPLRISPTGIAPKGAYVAADHQVDSNQLNVFYIGEDGSLYVTWVIAGGVWQGPVSISPLGIAPGGACIATDYQVDTNQLDVFFIGEDGGLYVSWVIGGGVWQGPMRISLPSIAAKGACLATAHQVDNNQLDVFFIGKDGGLYVSWVIGGGVWQGPVRISPTGIAPSGACIATAHQVDNNQLDIFFIGEDEGLYVSWAIGGGIWQGPMAISPAGIAPKKAGIATAHQVDDHQLDVFFIGKDNGLNVSWVTGGGIWENPVNVTGGFRLNPIMEDDHFYPFTYSENGQVHTLPGDSTPTGAFSYGNNMFVFFYNGLPNNDYFSGLSFSSNPLAAEPYDLLFKLSTHLNSQFFQVAPFVINNKEFDLLPSNDGDGLIFFGHGWNPKENCNGVHLAWMPLQLGNLPIKETIKYYSGTITPSWSDKQDDATLFFKTEGWSSISVGRIPTTGHWIFLNQTCGGEDFSLSLNGPIIARIADVPWGIAKANPINIFDPIRDHALGTYMFREDRFDPKIHSVAFAYGAYILNHYTEWDNESNIATLYYLMSTGNPYQVQVMQSKILILNV